MLQTKQTKVFTEGVVRKGKTTMPSKYTIQKEEVQEKIFESKGIPTAVSLKFIDIPKLHDFSE
jgi:hypothetical protein